LIAAQVAIVPTGWGAGVYRRRAVFPTFALPITSRSKGSAAIRWENTKWVDTSSGHINTPRFPAIKTVRSDCGQSQPRSVI